MPWIELPPPLQKLAGGIKKLQVEAPDLRSALEKVIEQFPVLENKIIGKNGHLYQYVKVYIDDENCDFLEGLQTPLQANSKVTLLVAMAGG